MLHSPEAFVCMSCGFELTSDDKSKIVAIEAEAPPPVGLSDDPLGVENPPEDPNAPPKYEIMPCPNCGKNEWQSSK